MWITSTSIFGDGRISTHADSTYTSCCGVTSWNIHALHALADSFDFFGLLPLGYQSSPKWENPYFGRRWTAVQNLTPPSLSSADDHNHAHFVGRMPAYCKNWYSLQYLTTLNSAVTVIWLEFHKLLMGHMTWPRPYQGRFVVRRLWLAHSTCTSNLKSLRSPIMKMNKATQNVHIEVI